MSAASKERAEDFDYVLPPEHIAQRPAPERQSAKLLIADISGAPFAHHQYGALPDLVRGDELFVLNDTRVVPARLFGHKPTGGRALGPR